MSEQHPSQSACEPDTIVTAPIWEGEGHHPDLTKSETGCHVWRGSTYGPCFKHGTTGCCLITHASSRAQRAFGIPRCNECGRWMKAERIHEEFCASCEDEHAWGVSSSYVGSL